MVIRHINVRENRRGNLEWTIKRQWKHWAHKYKTNKRQRKPKGQSGMDNQETQEALGTQDTGRRQTKAYTTQKTSKMSNKLTHQDTVGQHIMFVRAVTTIEAVASSDFLEKEKNKNKNKK